MGLTVMGLVVVGLGLGALLFAALPLRIALIPAALLFGATIPMSASAAVVLSFGGGASILLSAVAAGIFCLACLPRVVQAMAAGPPAALFWFITFTAVAIAGAFLLPVAFEGATMVFALNRAVEGVTDEALKLPLIPLGPGASAITQSVWLFSTAVVFVTIAISARRNPALVTAILWAATLSQLSLAILDYLGWQGMALFRTAAYEIAPDQGFSGFIRLTGAATEPSQFGGVSVALAAWHMWRVRFGFGHGICACLLTLCAVASLSTTAIATLGLVVFCGGFVFLSSVRSFGALALMSLVGLVAVICGGWLYLGPLSGPFNGLIDALFISKISSESGVERGIWAMQALRNLADTYGLGTGLGSAKASGWATALLGQTGLIGAGLMLIFICSVLRGSRGDRPARALFLTVLCAALLSEGRVDPGYLFAVSAGAVVARHAPQKRAIRPEAFRHAAPAL